MADKGSSVVEREIAFVKAELELKRAKAVLVKVDVDRCKAVEALRKANKAYCKAVAAKALPLVNRTN